MRWLAVLLALLGTVFVTGPRDAPVVSSPTIEAMQEGDSLVFSIGWTAPSREGAQTPITGYEWELRTIVGPSLADTAASGVTTADVLTVRVTIVLDCSQGPTIYRARVRATGDFSGPAGWGTSPTVTISCDNAPPGAPEVTLDTLDVTDWLTRAEVREYLPLGAVGPAGGPIDLEIGQTNQLCAYFYADDQLLLVDPPAPQCPDPRVQPPSVLARYQRVS